MNKPQYAILRFAKYKGPEIGNIEAHNERTKEKYASNPDVDISRSKYNFHLIEPERKYRAEAERQIKKAGCRTRSDSVQVVEALVTATPEFFQGKKKSEIRAYFQEALAFLQQNQDPNRKYWTIIGKGWQRPKRLYKLGEEYTNDRIMERISENSYAVKFQSFSEPQPQAKVYRVKGSLKNAKKIGGLRGLYLHYCYKLGILPKGRKQNYARLHYLLKDDLMKMEAITQETRLLCRNHIVVLDSILNRITQNRAKGRNTFIFIDEIYLLFQHEYSANFLFTLWKRVRKYGAYCTGITQNVDDLLQSHTARTMLANSEFIIMLNQASTDRLELAKLFNISDLQMSYITNVGAGQGLLKVGSSLVPFVNKFPRNTELYKLMTTKFGEV